MVTELKVSGSFAMGKQGGGSDPSWPKVGSPLQIGPRRQIARQHRVLILRTLQAYGRPVLWRELKEAGVDYYALREMVREGSIVHPANGVFAIQGDYDPIVFALSSLAVHGTDFCLCLTTAATLHGLLDEMDRYLWIMLADNRKTLNEVYGLTTMPVRWNMMRYPIQSMDLNNQERLQIGWHREMSAEESTERYFGVERWKGYGVQFKTTALVRTICDILRFRNKNLRRTDFEGATIGMDVASSVLLKYAMKHDLADLRTMAARLEYGPDVLDLIALAERTILSSAPPK
jgi:hypothetical protein